MIALALWLVALYVVGILGFGLVVAAVNVVFWGLVVPLAKLWSALDLRLRRLARRPFERGHDGRIQGKIHQHLPHRR
jgi:hypothetical protein